jgi:predicted amidohydrolase
MSGFILGTERVVGDALVATALVIDRDGAIIGFQDKVQLDPSEENLYSPGSDRRTFQIGPVTFGVVICHEGWRYPETCSLAVRHNARIVFHPHFHEAEPGGYVPSSFAEPSRQHGSWTFMRSNAEAAAWLTFRRSTLERHPTFSLPQPFDKNLFPSISARMTWWTAPPNLIRAGR